MKIIDPKDLIIHVNETPPVAKRGDKISIDTEFFEMQKSRLHRPHGRFAGMGCSFDGQEVWIITDEVSVPDFMALIDEGVHIYHNAKFDIGQIRRYCDYPDRTKLWDTMVIEQIMYAGWYSASEFGLNDLARRYLDVYMSKDVRDEFSEEDAPTSMTQDQINYLAVDVVATWRVYQEQKKRVDENDLNIWKNVDRGAIFSILRMKGMMLDKVAWSNLYNYNVSEYKKIDAKYPNINIGSWQQVLAELKRLGYTDLPNTQEKTLNTILDECEFARDVLKRREHEHAASTYGIQWAEELVEEDGRIWSDFYVNGAGTGRFSSSKPNVENIPVRDGPHFRKCFVAQPGYVLVDADFSAQEPRVWSYISGDEDMQNLFRDKNDLYIYFAKEGFGWDIDKKDPRRNKRMKPTVLGAIFGLTKYGLLQKDQIPLDEGDELLNAFWKVFKRSKQYKDEIQKERQYVQTVYGRKYWLNTYQFGYENNCLNSPVQGTAADITKISGYRFQLEVDKAGYSEYIFLINYIHDELLVECREDLKDWTMEILHRVMKETAEACHDGVPAEIEVAAGHSWADCH